MESKTGVFATLSKNKILKDVSNEITTFLAWDPPKTDSESKPNTALENNAPKCNPTSEHYHFGPPFGTPGGDNFEQEAPQL